ncbi:MAG TPA: DUF58 domain-containing protein [Allosphingosinicella sp.]|nr:DUF58 domain-containing protein [Allosphingosinicella sp.]
MIYPTRRLVLAAAGVAPLALVIGVAAPQFWFAGLALLVFLLALGGVDALAGAGPRSAEAELEGPAAAGVGETFELAIHLRFGGASPRAAQAALAADPLLDAPEGYRRWTDIDDGAGSATLPLTAVRRGTAQVACLWIRWRGPLGLVWKQRRAELHRPILITPDIRPVRQKSAQLLHRDSAHGLAPQLQVGEGAEFEALSDYRAGMDRRTIDWKQSARHRALLAKEFRTERNNNIILALDAGRAMCEPLAGVPRIDRAISAALLTAFVALKDGDRVGLFGFDSHPRVASKAVSGSRAFALLQRVAAEVDYSARETNYTLALATLASGLNRRSLIIIFTDFADTISAELMLNAVGALLKRHLVLFIVMRDQELETLAAAEPRDAEDVTRAVTAFALLRERRLVITRLRHLGVHVLEAGHEEAGPALVSTYLHFKRKDLL